MDTHNTKYPLLAKHKHTKTKKTIKNPFKTGVFEYKFAVRHERAQGGVEIKQEPGRNRRAASCKSHFYGLWGDRHSNRHGGGGAGGDRLGEKKALRACLDTALHDLLRGGVSAQDFGARLAGLLTISVLQLLLL